MLWRGFAVKDLNYSISCSFLPTDFILSPGLTCWFVGRSGDIVVPNCRSCSRIHASITRRVTSSGDEFHVFDGDFRSGIRSKLGILLNSRPVTYARIFDGDVLHINNIRNKNFSLTFHLLDFRSTLP
jgi:FHA domain